MESHPKLKGKGQGSRKANVKGKQTETYMKKEGWKLMDFFLKKIYFEKNSKKRKRKIEAIYQLKKTSNYSQNDPPGPEQNLKKK